MKHRPLLSDSERTLHGREAFYGWVRQFECVGVVMSVGKCVSVTGQRDVHNV